MKLTTALFSLAFALLSANLLAKDNPVKLKELKGIYAEHPDTEPLKQIIGDFRSCYFKMYGKQLPLFDKAPAEGESAIVIGDAAVKAGLLSKADVAKASPGGFVIKSMGGIVAVAGDSDWSTAFGVGHLLEKLGVCYARGPVINSCDAKNPTVHTKLPENPPETLADFADYEKPVLTFRNGFSLILGEMSGEIANPREIANPEIFKGTDQWMDHSAGALVPKDLYYDKHPEYYAMTKEGKRIAKDGFTYHRTPLCLSNPDVTKISIERALEWVRLNPQKKYFFVSYGDTGLWCQCPECLKLDEVQGQYAARLLKWVNVVADAIGEKYPDKVVLTFAYGGSNATPAKIKPAKNVRVVIATGLGNIPFYDHAKKAKLEMYETSWHCNSEWMRVSTLSPLVCEYIGGMYQPAFVDQTAARYREYAERGMGGVAFSYGSPTNFKNMWAYLHGKLLWNPKQDAMKLAGGFADYYYGAAARPVKEYLELVHRKYLKTLDDGDELVSMYPKGFYDDAFIKKALDCFDRAVAAVQDNKALAYELTSERVLFCQDAFTKALAVAEDRGNNKMLSYLVKEIIEGANRAGKTDEAMEYLNASTFRTWNKEGLADKKPKLGEFIKEVMSSLPALQPKKIPGGLQLSPMMFTGAEYGPKVFGPDMSHSSLQCPPKVCAGTIPKTGARTKGEMEMRFYLEGIPGAGAAVLDLEGQNAANKWASEKDVKNTDAKFTISVNEKEIYNGNCLFVRGNWSRQSFEIPVGTLRAGTNVIKIRNTSQWGGFVTNWILVGDVKLFFEDK